MNADVPKQISAQNPDRGSYSCPVCMGNTGVSDSRPAPFGVRRRRCCKECGHRFTTYETELSDSGKFVELLDRLLLANQAVTSEIVRIRDISASVRALTEVRSGVSLINRKQSEGQNG